LPKKLSLKFNVEIEMQETKPLLNSTYYDFDSFEGHEFEYWCKCYSSDLGNTPVQEVWVGKSMYHCQIGVVMTNRYFTKGARELADTTGVLLWDRDRLLKMMNIGE